MRKTCGAMLALTVLAVLLVGPLFVAMSSAHESYVGKYRCKADLGCDGISADFPAKE